MLNILFIGNSFTFVNDLPAMLTAVAADAGVEIAASSVLKGGAYLHQFTLSGCDCFGFGFAGYRR